jgi:hypothetical protein
MQMRTSKELERLSAAEPSLLGQTESFVDASEEERILELILASGRPRAAGRGWKTRRRRTAFLLVGAALAAAVVAVASIGHGNRTASRSRGQHDHLALSGATIQLAGYRFKTPAGFKTSTSTCGAPAASPGKPTAVLNGFAAAASADGGCVEAAYLIAPSTQQGGLIPKDAQSVDVGQYQGYYLAQSVDGRSALYVGLPKAGGTQNIVYLVLLARDLTEDQLIAVARSGLPG